MDESGRKIKRRLEVGVPSAGNGVLRVEWRMSAYVEEETMKRSKGNGGGS